MLDPYSLARRDLFIGLLVIFISGRFITVGWMFPSWSLLSNIGAPLLAAAAGAVTSSFWSARIADSTDRAIERVDAVIKKSDEKNVQQEVQVARAIDLLAFKDTNLSVLDDSYLKYTHLFWRTEDKSGPLWRCTILIWRRASRLPIATAMANVASGEGGAEVEYHFLMQKVRGRLIVYITSAASEEPTGVVIADTQVLTDRLYGIQRHMTWLNNERISPTVISTEIGMAGYGELKECLPLLSKTQGEMMDKDWQRFKKFDFNFSQTA